MKKRYDMYEVPEGMFITHNGFLKGDGIVTRIGIFKYMNSDGTIRKELRHPEDVLKMDSINTMKMIPVTNEHPNEFVSPDNSKQLSVGHVGENIKPDGNYIYAPIVITDSKTISDVNQGKNQLSLGYETDVVEEVGEWDGETYEYRQTNIMYNHLAIVNSARAGENAKLKKDSNIDYAVQCNDSNDIKDKKTITTKRKEDTMPTKKIDGIEYEAAQEVINHSSKLEAKNDSLSAELKKTKTQLSTVTAERDDKAEKLTIAEQKKDNNEEIKKLVNDRVELIGTAKNIVKDSDVNFDEMDNTEIKKSIIKNVFPSTNFDSDKWSDSIYVDARFDSVKEMKKDDSVNKQQKTIFDPSKTKNDANEDDYDAVSQRADNDLLSAWKNENK